MRGQRTRKDIEKRCYPHQEKSRDFLPNFSKGALEQLSCSIFIIMCQLRSVWSLAHRVSWPWMPGPRPVANASWSLGVPLAQSLLFLHVPAVTPPTSACTRGSASAPTKNGGGSRAGNAGWLHCHSQLVTGPTALHSLTLPQGTPPCLTQNPSLLQEPPESRFLAQTPQEFLLQRKSSQARRKPVNTSFSQSLSGGHLRMTRATNNMVEGRVCHCKASGTPKSSSPLGFVLHLVSLDPTSQQRDLVFWLELDLLLLRFLDTPTQNERFWKYLQQNNRLSSNSKYLTYEPLLMLGSHP